MVSSQFGGILKEFEPFFGCELEPDSNNSCLILMDIGLSIQIELNRYGLLLVGCRMPTLPRNRFGDNLIKAALKFNELSLPSTGIFGYSQKYQQLILFIKIDPNDLNPQFIQEILTPFIKKAKNWVDAVKNDKIPSLGEETEKARATGLFGIIS